MSTLVSDGSRADVQAKIDAAYNGDTVTIPSGSFSWASGVTISGGKYVTLRGAGGRRVFARSNDIKSIPTAFPTSVTFSLVTEDSRIASIEARKSELTIGSVVRCYKAGGEIDVTVAYPTGPYWWGITGQLPWMQGVITAASSTSLTISVTSSNNASAPELNASSFGPWIIMREAVTTVIADTGSYSQALRVYDGVGGSVKLEGIHFGSGTMSGDSRCVRLDYTAGGSPTLIYNCSGYSALSGIPVFQVFTYRGVMYDCSFPYLPAMTGSNGAISISEITANYGNSWTTPSTMGAEDIGGTRNFYIEDCDFHYLIDGIDTSDNARVVYRNCLFNNSGVGMHGNDTGYYGTRHWDIYENAFVFSNLNGGAQAYALDGWITPRGGTGVITNNLFDDIEAYGSWGSKLTLKLQAQPLSRNAGTTPLWGSNNDTAITSISVASPTVITSPAHGMTTGDFVRISGSNSTPSVDGRYAITRLTADTYSIAVNVTVAGNTGKSNRIDYPYARQIGRGYVTGTGVDGLGNSVDGSGTWVGYPGSGIYVGDSEPLYYWNNGGAGEAKIGVDDQDQGGATDRDLPSDYIIAGRDYFADGTAKSGWTAYTYPHPLRSATLEPPPPEVTPATLRCTNLNLSTLNVGF